MNVESSKVELDEESRTSKDYVDRSFRSTYKSTSKKVLIKDERISRRGETTGISTAKQMLIQSAKKDKTAEKMSFVVGVTTYAETDSQQDIDELLEELLDQLDQMPELSEELLEEYTEIYLMIDPKNDGYIDAPKLFRALHTVGFDPTEAEVMDIIDAVDINKLVSIFLAKMSKLWHRHWCFGLVLEKVLEAYVLWTFKTLFSCYCIYFTGCKYNS